MTEMMTRTYYKGIPSAPRYDLIKCVASETLLNYASNSIPISLTSIVENFDNLELRSYDWYMNSAGCSLDYIINDLVKSEEGGLLRISDINGVEEYYILYNKNKMVGRKRFTIAHELGHFLLEHYKLIDNTVISRGEISNTQYKVLEQEANLFARLILAPLSLIAYMGKSWGRIKREHLMDIFNITYTVSGNVISHINKQQNKGFTPYNTDIIDKFKESLNRFINIHICRECKSEFILENPNYCPICNNANITRIMSKDYQTYIEFERCDFMIYDGIELDKGSKAIVCPKCGNEEPEVGNYCSICGVYLVNECTNEICNKKLQGNARYCTYCGAQSTFLQNDILLPWNAEDENGIPYYDDIPF